MQDHDDPPLPAAVRGPDGVIRGVRGGNARRFHLVRDADISGVSGTGVVAEGIRFSDGTAVTRWIVGDHPSTVVWPRTESVIAVHGHGGATRLLWLDS